MTNLEAANCVHLTWRRGLHVLSSSCSAGAQPAMTCSICLQFYGQDKEGLAHRQQRTPTPAAAMPATQGFLEQPHASAVLGKAFEQLRRAASCRAGQQQRQAGHNRIEHALHWQADSLATKGLTSTDLGDCTAQQLEERQLGNGSP